MNKDMMRRVEDAIRAEEKHTFSMHYVCGELAGGTVKPTGLSTGQWRKDGRYTGCNTTACIAGFAIAVATDEEFEAACGDFSSATEAERCDGVPNELTIAQRLLGVDDDELQILCIPDDSGVTDREVEDWNYAADPEDNGYISKQHALRALARVREKGVVTPDLWDETSMEEEQ